MIYKRNLIPHQQSRRFLRAGGVRRVRRDVRRGDREEPGQRQGTQDARQGAPRARRVDGRAAGPRGGAGGSCAGCFPPRLPSGWHHELSGQPA